MDISIGDDSLRPHPPINTGQSRTSNRSRTGRNDNRKETRCNYANFNKFLDCKCWVTRSDLRIAQVVNSRMRLPAVRASGI